MRRLLLGALAEDPGHSSAEELAAYVHARVPERCSSMTEVPDEIFASLTETARTRYGFTIQSHRFAVIGLCSNCQ